MKLKFSVFAATMLLSSTAFAAGPMGSFSAYVTLSEAEMTFPGSKVNGDGTGFGIKGWFSPTGDFFGQYEYQVTGLDDPGLGKADLESLRVGGGYFHAVSETTGFYGLAQYIDFGSDFDEDGFGVHGGIHHQLNKFFSLGATLGYLKLDDTDGLEISAGSSVRITPNWGAFLDVRQYMGSAEFFDLDVTDIRVGASFNFGM